MKLDFWRFVIEVKWAKSLTWGKAHKYDKDSETEILLFAIRIIGKGENKAISIIVLPVMIIVGFV